MKVGVRSNSIIGDTLGERLKILKKLGYNFAELVLTAESVDNLNLDEDSKKYNKVSNEAGIPFTTTSFGPFSRFGSKSFDERKLTLDRVKKIIDLTALLGGEVILLAAFENTDDIYTYLGIYKGELIDIADYAFKKEIYLALEPVGGFKTSVLSNLVWEIGHPSVGLYYDMGNCMYAGEDPVVQLRAALDITRAIHIKGGYNKDETQMSLSETPLYPLLKVIKKGEKDVPTCVEISAEDGTNKHLIEALEILRNIGWATT